MNRWLISICCGVLLTVVLTALSFTVMVVSDGRARGVAKVILWQAAIVTSLVPSHNIGTAEEPIYEATPVDLFLSLVGILLGIPIYTVASYFVLSKLAERKKRRGATY